MRKATSRRMGVPSTNATTSGAGAPRGGAGGVARARMPS
jgi:hypothetical protein